MSDEVKVEEKQEEEQVPNIAGFLAAVPGSPSEEHIEQWKTKYGDVFCSAFSDTEVFIWRPLARAEFLEVQEKANQVRQAGGQVSDGEAELEVVKVCILWASEPGWGSLEKKAGSVSTLNEQVMLASNFLPTQMAASMVIKL